jgi:hypothetical protein
MSSYINENGLTLETTAETRAAIEADLKEIYGSDINLDSNTPDGQLVGIYTQAKQDILSLINSVNNSFNPDSVTGILQDLRYAILGIERSAADYTIQPIDIVISQNNVSLQGLDADFNDPDGSGFTASDDEGNQFILEDSETFAIAGTYSRNFRAKNIGAVQTTVSTITNINTPIVGVSSVNNSSGALSVGQDGETSAQYRVRAQRGIVTRGRGYIDTLEANIENLDGVTQAKVYENVTDVTDSDGIPSKGIWSIVQGGANTEIATEIYSYLTYGTPQKSGSVSVNITSSNGTIKILTFDRPSAKDLYIRFDIQPTISGAVFNQADIKTYIVANKDYGIGDFAGTSSLTTLAQEAIDNVSTGGIVVNLEISDDGAAWVDYLEVDTLDEQWVLATDKITITEI